MTNYTRDQITELNITLSTEFSLYVVEHPDFAARIPKGARVVLLPKNDPELSRINREIAEKARSKDDQPDRPVIFIEFERLKPVRSRLVKPRVVRPGRALQAA
ncbi:MAG: hypothetical protein HY023_02785 [Chloroflexi bacterium]|nr:hypothetical protein [Chloroflexota bacterium]